MMAVDEKVVTDLAKFGWRELRLARDLLNAMIEDGVPDDFDDEGIQVAFNLESGYVFLTNEQCDVAMLNGDKLESWYWCPECGHEGFAEDMEHEGGAECQRYLRQIGVTAEGEE